VLSRGSAFAKLDDSIEHRSKTFVRSGIKPIDALHLVSAEKMNADFFCTCDDKFLKKAKEIRDLRIRAMSIFELLKEIEK
jgi:predicted nucleic acid-binding protein